MGKKSRKKPISSGFSECWKCNKVEYLFAHHFIAVMFRGLNPFVVGLCKPCHDKADEIALRKHLTPSRHFELFYEWLYGRSPRRRYL